jgi:CMP-N-acetylneuraminate monooxygenase
VSTPAVVEADYKRPTNNIRSHATLSIEYDGFTLVTDPWPDGPAFLNAGT